MAIAAHPCFSRPPRHSLVLNMTKLIDQCVTSTKKVPEFFLVEIHSGIHPIPPPPPLLGEIIYFIVVNRTISTQAKLRVKYSTYKRPAITSAKDRASRSCGFSLSFLANSCDTVITANFRVQLLCRHICRYCWSFNGCHRYPINVAVVPYIVVVFKILLLSLIIAPQWF